MFHRVDLPWRYFVASALAKKVMGSKLSKSSSAFRLHHLHLHLHLLASPALHGATSHSDQPCAALMVILAISLSRSKGRDPDR